MGMFRLFIRVLPVIYMIFIWWQSGSLNPESLITLAPYLGYTLVSFLGVGLELAHLFEFGLLYLFIALFFLSYGSISKRGTILALVISLLYGFIDEVHQYFVPFRSPSLIDLLKDIVGVIVVWYVMHHFYLVKKDSKINAFLTKITELSQKH